MEEIWRPFNNYEVNTTGIVRNTKTGQVLRPGKDTKGYLFVVLYKDGVPKHCLVHRLVGILFPDLVGWTEGSKGRPLDELQINHKDQDKTNNRVENLEWCDNKYNKTYSSGKTVYQYTLDGSLCGMWPSIQECGRHGFDYGSISKCCNSKLKKHKGFLWSYNPPSQFQ